MVTESAALPLNTVERYEYLFDEGCEQGVNLNFAATCSYKGHLKAHTLQQALTRLRDLHPLWQRTIQNVAGKPCFVAYEGPLPFTKLSQNGCEEEGAILARELRSYVVDKEPLWRVTMLKGAGEGKIIISYHHAIADGVCAMKAFDHLFQILSDIMAQREPRTIEFVRGLPPLEDLYHLYQGDVVGKLAVEPREAKRHHMCFANKLLTENATKGVLNWTREQGIKAHGAYYAALLLALHSHGYEGPVNAITAVNLRPYFDPPVSKDLMALLRVCISSQYNVTADTRLETLAHTIHRDVHSQLEDGEHIRAIKELEKRLEGNPSPEEVWRGSLLSSNSVAVTNIGALDFTGTYEGSHLSIEELSFYANIQPFFAHNGVIMGILTFKGRTQLSLWGIQEHVSKDTLQSILTDIEKRLKDL